MVIGRKVALTLVFAGLLLLAFGAGCRGFFVNPTLSSIAINPTAPQVSVNQSTSVQVYGTYTDGSRSIVTSGVGWSSSEPGVATITGTGSGTLTGVSSGSTTITASAQALSTTATATVIGNVTAITVTPTSQNVVIGGTGVGFTFAATPGPPTYITADNGGTLVITPADGLITCSVSTDGSGNPNEVCTAATGAQSSYTINMTYPSPTGGIVTSNTATLTVSQ
jgi:hypothetical protein